MIRRLVSSALVLAALAALPVAAAAVPTAFTYQGQLTQGSLPATGTYNFTFRLFDSLAGGTQVGGDLSFSSLQVTNGLFSVDLDFGSSAFTGANRWLEVEVMGPADGAPTILAPRTAINSAPYAVYAAGALGSTGGGSSQWFSNGPDLTYPTGSVGVTGASSPFAGGKGVFFEGGNATYANVWAYNYDGHAPLSLLLNAPGGYVGVNTYAPTHSFEVAGNAQVTYTGNTLDGGGYSSALWVTGNTGNPYLLGRVSNGVTAFSTDGRAMYGVSTNNLGVVGECTLSGNYTMLGTPSEALYASSHSAAQPAGHFVCPTGGLAVKAEGLVQVKTLQILGGADLAERFPVTGDPEPGTVLVIDETHPGALRVSDAANSRAVAGVVSGAHGLSAGAVLSDGDVTEGTAAVALSGRVWVKCDASAGAIHAGDRLTTATRTGYAMRADAAAVADGAVLGKAMTSLEAGTGMVLVLVSLR